jgi:hypothetical protein
LGELYGLTIPQLMELWRWKSYPRATEALKSICYDPIIHRDSRETVIYPGKPELIYRVRRHGSGKDVMAGDVYVLLTAGAQKIRQSMEDYDPPFYVELNKARQLTAGIWSHTLLVNSVLIKLKLFADAHPVRFRVEGGVHERRMRKDYEKAFKLYPDGVIKFLIKRGNDWKHRLFFLEVERTSAQSKDKWQAKVRQYINLFEYKLQTYFHTDIAFVLVLVTVPEFVHHLVHWTEETLQEMGDVALSYRTRFCIGLLDLSLPPTEFFCLPRFYEPFEDSPREVFDGLVLAQPKV